MVGRGSTSLAQWRRRALRHMAASRREAAAFIAQLSPREIPRPRTQDRWSVKDVLGHLMSCDEETVKRFRLIARGHADRIQWFESMAYADRFNARTVARTRRLGLAALLRRKERVGAELIEWFARLPTESLRDSSHQYPVVEWLPAPGWSHERDHIGGVMAWWRARRKERHRT